VNELDATVACVRAHGPAPLPLDGWDHASIWGWDETASSLYAHLWRNDDDPAKPPSIQVESGDYTPSITFPESLAQHVAMATGCNPWEVLTALLKIDAPDQYRYGGHKGSRTSEPGTTATLTQGYKTRWPPDQTL
jgi:hypothetical protein